MEINTTAQLGSRHTIESVTPGQVGGLMPEFLRPADGVRLFGIGKSTLAEILRTGRVKSHLVRVQGQKSGMRLISTASLREYIESH